MPVFTTGPDESVPNAVPGRRGPRERRAGRSQARLRAPSPAAQVAPLRGWFGRVAGSELPARARGALRAKLPLLKRAHSPPHQQHCDGPVERDHHPGGVGCVGTRTTGGVSMRLAACPRAARGSAYYSKLRPPPSPPKPVAQAAEPREVGAPPRHPRHEARHREAGPARGAQLQDGAGAADGGHGALCFFGGGGRGGSLRGRAAVHRLDKQPEQSRPKRTPPEKR